MRFNDDAEIMQRALDLAASGIGRVEPNPPVGAVVVDDERNLLGEGFHERFGGPHAEINALAAVEMKAESTAGATVFVTLEPCRHQGQTGPCTQALIAAGVKRVVAAVNDPSPQAAGRGFDELRAAGIQVEVGLLADRAERLAAAFFKLTRTGTPWVHAKWAMTLDGKIATRTGDSRWISNERARRVVHELRGRMDAIIVGAETALKDDPQLTARPPGPRVAARVVVDSTARLPLASNLVETISEAPVLVAVGETAPPEKIDGLRNAGVEVLALPGPSGGVDLCLLLKELGRRRFTHVLVEGGGKLLGSLCDSGGIDELHAFIAPKLFGGADATSPLAGLGLELVPERAQFEDLSIEKLDDNVYIHGVIR